jgi:hypothetical protein
VEKHALRGTVLIHPSQLFSEGLLKDTGWRATESGGLFVRCRQNFNGSGSPYFGGAAEDGGHNVADRCLCDEAMDLIRRRLPSIFSTITVRNCLASRAESLPLYNWMLALPDETLPRHPKAFDDDIVAASGRGLSALWVLTLRQGMVDILLSGPTRYL